MKDKSEGISVSVQIDAMKKMMQFVKTRMAQPKESETEDNMFEKMIASKLKKFPENLKSRLKHKYESGDLQLQIKSVQYNDLSYVCNFNWFPSYCWITKVGF